MKSSFLGSVALFAIYVGVAARAADMPVKAPPIPRRRTIDQDFILAQISVARGPTAA